jgi:His/Glu/Gln/Arg/opine family amino acid ABC transporter permease subunit
VEPADPARGEPPRVVNRGGGSTGSEDRPEAIKAVPIRHWGRWVASAVILYIFAALIYSLAKNQNLEWDTVGVWLFKPLVLRGVVRTLELTFIAMAIGIVGGTLLAVMRLSKNYVLSGLAWLYIWFFRGTPVYVQILIWGYFGILYPRLFLGLPFTGFVFGSVETNTLIGVFVASILALGLNEAAYAAELVRAGIISVDRGQYEAADSLGMSFSQTMRRVILPQAMRVIIPPMGNETISMLKTTSLVAVIAGRELMTNVQIAYSQNFKIMPLLIVACIWYIFLTTLLTIGQHYLEKYFAKGFGDKEAAAAEKRAMKRLERKAGVDPGVF